MEDTSATGGRIAREMGYELTARIFPFWMGRMTDPAGGFFGRMDGNGVTHAVAEKGAVLNARILWTFAAAYRLYGKEEYLGAAERAYREISGKFIDRKFGGVYWSLNPDGTPADMHKQFYALGFAVYGLSEYVRAIGDKEALELAKSLYRDIIRHSKDSVYGGYIEAASRDWQQLADMRLSEKDANTSKSMNTHLHIIEPFTNLYRVWPDKGLEMQLRELVRIFLDRILDPETGHLGLFFNSDWTRTDRMVSYGHDIEASWLLLETAGVIGDTALYEEVKEATRKIALASFEGLCDDGSMVYERHPDGTIDVQRHWWVQAETVIGQLYLWKFHGMGEMLGNAAKSWEYIKGNLISPDGEWYWGCMPDGTPNRTDDLAGFWKCPYHNSRMVMESLRLLCNKNPEPVACDNL